jgi:nickel superoxide dismutase
MSDVPEDDLAQARIAAEGVKASQEKYRSTEDPHLRERAKISKEGHAREVGYYVAKLRREYFTDEHFRRYPELNALLVHPDRLAADVKVSNDPKTGETLVGLVAEIDKFVQKTKNT